MALLFSLSAGLPLAATQAKKGQTPAAQKNAAAAAPAVKADTAAQRLTADVAASFRVGPGDVLHVNVWKEPDITADVIVRPDGFISLPLLKDLYVNEMTSPEIEKAITERLSKFLATPPDVTVMLKQVNSKKIYVIGQVHRVGATLLLAPMTVAQALSEAGGPTEYANTKGIIVLRNVDGKQRIFKFNYKDFLKGKAQEQNIPLVPGDTIVVP